MTLQVIPKKAGRPPNRDYEVLRADIENLIEKGYGVNLIGLALGMSAAGARKLLERMRLKTQVQVLRSAAMQALIDKHAETKASPHKGIVRCGK